MDGEESELFRVATTHDGTILVGNNRVGPKQPSNRRVTDSRVERPSPFQVTFFFCDFFWLVALSRKKKKDRGARAVVVCAANFLDTNQASINPYLHWCGYDTPPS